MDVRVVSWLIVALCACGDRKAAPAPSTGTAPASSDAAGRTLIDRTAEATAILSHWNAPDAAEKIHGAAHPRFQKSVTLEEMRIFHDDFAARIGPFVAVKTSQGIEHVSKTGDQEDMVRGLVQFERGEAPYELVLVDHQGKPAMLAFKLELPPALQTPPVRAEARALATTFNTALFAVDVPRIDELSLPRIRGQLAPDDIKRMREFVASLGANPTVAVESDRECGDSLHCMRYKVTGPKGRAIIEQTLSAPLGRWRVVNWKFEPDDSKPEEKKIP